MSDDQTDQFIQAQETVTQRVYERAPVHHQRRTAAGRPIP